MRTVKRIPRWPVVALLAMVFGLIACESEDTPNTSSTRVEITVADSMTVVRVLETDDRFSTLRAALDSTRLDSVLATDGPYTLFAPPNEAFEALPTGTMETLLADRHERLRTILAHHVVDGRLSLEDLANPRTVVAMSGDTLSLCSTQKGVTVNGISVVDSDVEAANGLLHVVDRVLPPPDSETQ